MILHDGERIAVFGKEGGTVGRSLPHLRTSSTIKGRFSAEQVIAQFVGPLQTAGLTTGRPVLMGMHIPKKKTGSKPPPRAAVY